MTRNLGFTRLLLVGTGSVSAAFLPYWMNWLRLTHPGVEPRIVLTRSAETFVTRHTLTSMTGREVLLDAWPGEPEIGARHVELEEWAEAIVVYPATLHFVARLALGLADSPALLAAQCTDVPIGVAPSLPPGGLESAVYQQHLAALAQRSNIVVAPPRPGRSGTTGREDAWICAELPVLLDLVDQLGAS